MKQSFWSILALAGLASCNNTPGTLPYNAETGCYEIGTAEELGLLSRLSCDTTIVDESGRKIHKKPYRQIKVVLTNDIEVGNDFQPIDGSYCYVGEFNGNGHSITFKDVEQTFEVEDDGDIEWMFNSESEWGLFRDARTMTVKDLTLKGNVHLYIDKPTDNFCIGSLAGEAEGVRMENCQSSVELKVTGSTEDKKYEGRGIFIGGLAGRLGMEVSKYSTFAGKTTFNGNIHVDAGNVRTKISVGGIAGEANHIDLAPDALVENRGDVQISMTSAGNSNYVGGVFGQINDTKEQVITNCHNHADIQVAMAAAGNFNYVGGVFGQVYCIEECVITDCHNHAGITVTSKGTDTYLEIGGVAGNIDASSRPVSILNLTNSGAVLVDSESSLSLGGVIGETDSSNRHYVMADVTNSGLVTVDKTPDEYSDVGGVLGQGACIMHKVANKGKIQFNGNDEKMNIGGVVGSDGFSRVSIIYSCCSNEDTNYPIAPRSRHITKICDAGH